MPNPLLAIARRLKPSLGNIPGWAGDDLQSQIDSDVNAGRQQFGYGGNGNSALADQPQQRPVVQRPPPPMSEESTPPQPNPLARQPLGDAPPPPQLADRDQSATRTRYTNPLQYAESGRPLLRPDNYGSDPLMNQIAESNALQQWQPREKRSLGGIGKGALYAALPALARGDVFGAAGAATVGAAGTAINPNFGGNLRRKWLLDQSNATVNQGLDQAQQQATIANAQTAPVLREQQIKQGEERLKQGEARINQQAELAQKRNLATQYNGLKEFDPDDPKNAEATISYTKAFGFRPPRKITGSLLQFIEGTDGQGNATFTVIDKGSGKAQEVTGTGLPVKTEGQLNRETNAKQQGLNRELRQHITTQIINAQNNRQDKQITSEIGKLGDPEEIFQAASEAWDLAKEKEVEAGKIQAKSGYQLSTADAQRKQQLMKESAELRAATLRMQQEGRKADRANRVSNVSQSAPQSSAKLTLDGALRAFRARAKREPTAEEVANIKRHYGLKD